MPRPIPFLLCLVSMLMPSRAWSQQARLVDGAAFPATLEGLESQKALFRSGERSRTIAPDDLLIWGRPAEIRHGPYLLLADGGQVAGEIEAVSSDHVTIRSARRPGLWQTSRLPRASVRAIVFELNVNVFERDRSDVRRASPEVDDRLLLQSGDSLTGALLESAAPSEADDGPAFKFLPDGAREPLVIPQSRITAVVFRKPRDAGSRPEDGPAGTRRFWLAVADGSLVLADGIKRDGDSISIALARGGTLVARAVDDDLEPPESFWSRVELLQPLSSHIVYLSDLETIGFKHVPLFDWQIEYANDRSVAGSRLRAGQTRWLKGIGMPATSRLAYDVPQDAKRFEAEIALDDAAELHGSAIFRVYLESTEGTWKPAFESKTVRGGDPPSPVRVELGQSKRLALVVDMADHGDARDYADWLNARFVK